jgi:hypothetical protein
MKKTLVVLVASLGVFASAPAFAEAGPCAAIMCLSTGGSSPKECAKHIKSYFNIEDTKHGKFDSTRTAIKRAREVNNKCPDAKKEDVARVHAKYGGLHKSQNPFQFY